ncbi:MAG TPA: PHP domain-containing protein [Patescibacteria group bacterium]|nr:PHP domain-containing protein [Patescibacteria group bacterium]
MEPPCDLHLHSYYSDGNLSPAALVERARDAGLSAVSITDHDTVSGQEESRRAGREYGVEVLSGIEFSVMEWGHQIHILGYCYDTGDRRLGERVRFLEESRMARARAIVERLALCGIRISFDEVRAVSGRGTMGRPHIARVLLRRGIVGNIQDAFGRYIGTGRPAYVAKTVLPVEEVFRLIMDAGGVPVWAHPGAMIRKRSILDTLCSLGVRGIEVWHPNHPERLVEEIDRVALKRGLIRTGGSDYHFTDAMKADVGGISAPYDSVIALRKAAVAVRES